MMHFPQSIICCGLPHEQFMAHGHRLAVTTDVVTITLSTLGALTAILGAGKQDATRLQGMRFKKIKAHMEFLGKTAGEGPLMVGYAIDTTTSETGEALSADPQHRSDPSGEAQGRKVVPVWIIPKGSTGSEVVISHPDEMQDITMPYKELIEGSTLNWFVYNMDSGALQTGTVVNIAYVAVGEWLRD